MTNPSRQAVSILAIVALLLAAATPHVVLGQVVTTPKGATKPSAKKSVVPFEMLASNHMVVQANVNGKGPYRLIFDLGAPVTLLSPGAAEGAGVIRKGSARPLIFGGRGEERVKELKVGTLTTSDLSVVVLDHPTLRALGNLLGKPLDGIIGFTFFARYKTTIDYAAREMTFEPVDYRLPDLLKELPARLAGPKVAKRKVLAPSALFGMTVAEPASPVEGIPISAVVPGSPASTAGLKPGDLLTTLDGRWTMSVADAYSAASSVAPDLPVDLVVIRDGKTLILPITPRPGL